MVVAGGGASRDRDSLFPDWSGEGGFAGWAMTSYAHRFPDGRDPLAGRLQRSRRRHNGHVSQVGGRAGRGGTQAGLQPAGFLAPQPCTSGTGAGGRRRSGLRSRVSDSSTDKRTPTGGPVPPQPSLQPPPSPKMEKKLEFTCRAEKEKNKTKPQQRTC